MTFDEKVGLLMDIFIENNLNTLCASNEETLRLFRERGGNTVGYSSWKKVVTAAAVKLNLVGVTVPLHTPPGS